MKAVKSFVIFTLVMVLVIVSAACGKGGSSGDGKSAAPTQSATGQSQSFKPLEPSGDLVIPDKTGAKDNAEYIYPWQNFKAQKKWKIGYAILTSKWPSNVEEFKRLKRQADAMGIELYTFDNLLDTNKALEIADLVINKKLDGFIEAQIDPNVNKVIYEKLKDAGIPVIFSDIPGPEGSIYSGGDNYNLCFALGEEMGKYAKEKWNGKVDLVILEDLPTAGKIVEDRMKGYKQGIRSVLPGLEDKLFVSVDSGGFLDGAIKVTAPVITSHPDAANILVGGVNDGAALGAVRAIEASGRKVNVAAMGQPGEVIGLEELKKPENGYLGTGLLDVESYSWQLKLMVDYLEGRQIGLNNYFKPIIVTRDNVNQIPPQELKDLPLP